MGKPDPARFKQRQRFLLQDRGRRIHLLVERGLINEPADIPEHAIPIDPACSTKAQVWNPETFYLDIEFVCIDCGKAGFWSAEAQQYYFEVMKASPYKSAKRCYDCRLKEISRRNQARKDSGHDSSSPDTRE